MDASEASCSSRNLINDSPTVPYGEQRGRKNVHESNASASGGSNTPFATVFEGYTTSPGNVTEAIKLHPSFLINSSTSVIQSSWIQRLKPFGQRNTPKEELAKPFAKETLICTHFTKDFSSCSRRLNKSSHHTRSSSWPPNAMQGVERFPLEQKDSTGTAHGYGKAAIITPNIDQQIIEARSNVLTLSSDAGSRTGNLFAHQQGRCKQISVTETFEPSALKRENSTLRKLDDSEETEHGGDCKPKDWLTQHIQNSVKDFKKGSSVRECKVAALHMEALYETEEAANKCDFLNGSCGASTGAGHAPLLSVSMYTAAHISGASADADDRILFAKPLDCCMGIEPLLPKISCVKPDSEIPFPIAAALEGRIKGDKGGEVWCSGREIINTGVDTSNPGGVRIVKDCKQSKESVAKPYLLNNISGSRTVAASGSLKPYVLSKRLDGSRCRKKDLADLKDTHFSEGGQLHGLSPLIGSFHEKAARSRIREKSLGDYWNSWVRVLEGPDNVKVAKIGNSMAKLQQNYLEGEYDEILPPLASNNGRLKAKENFEDCHSHKHISDNFRNVGSYDLPQQRPGLSSKSSCKFVDCQIKLVSGQELDASADRSSQFNLKDLQSSQKHGSIGRVDLQPHNKEPDFRIRFLDDCSSFPGMHSPQGNTKRTGEESSMHRGWIQRWQSSAMSGKTTALVPFSSGSLSYDHLVKSNNASASQCPLLSNLKAMDPFNCTEFGTGSSRYMEISGTHLDSGLGSSTPGSSLAGRNFAAFRSGFMGSGNEPMATIRNSVSKPPWKSLQKRGFCGLPCTNPKFEECKVVPGDEKANSVDLDDLKTLEQHTGAAY